MTREISETSSSSAPASGSHSRESGLFRRVPTGLFWVAFGAYLLVRLMLLHADGYASDLHLYKHWALASGLMGFANVYESTGADYPPASVAALWAAGKAFVASQPPFAAGDIPIQIIPNWVIKLPHLVFDLLLGWLLHYLVSRRGLWGAGRRGPGWGRLAALFYWWNPAVLFGSAYWGQFDSMHAFLACAAVAALGADRLIVSAASLSLAGLSKPLAGPLLPVLVVTAALRHGVRGVVQAGLSGGLMAILVFAPFWATGRGMAVLDRVILDLDAMPYMSVNGHNLWWWLGGWRSADAPWLGPITPTEIGLLCFLAMTGWLLVRNAAWLRRTQGPEYAAGLFVISAAIISTFFFFWTHMHENHLFLVVPLLIAVAGRNPRLGALAAVASVCVFMNEILHDPEIPMLLPGWLSASSGTIDPHMQRPYTWLQLWGSMLNPALAALVFVGTMIEALRLGRSDRSASAADA